MNLRLKEFIKFEGTLTCKTGLRIGGAREQMEIGGMDEPVIRDPVTNEPYIPGSSLKGKLRSLLEYKLGKISPNGEPCGCAQDDCLICRIFGPHKQVQHGLGPSRILVRDARLSPKSKEELEKLTERTGLQFTEAKTEVLIDRRTGTAARGALRIMERVPAGASFDFRISLRIFAEDEEKGFKDKMVELIKEGLGLLKEDYLGGSGSRGYGEVEVKYSISSTKL